MVECDSKTLLGGKREAPPVLHGAIPVGTSSTLSDPRQSLLTEIHKSFLCSVHMNKKSSHLSRVYMGAWRCGVGVCLLASHFLHYLFIKRKLGKH